MLDPRQLLSYAWVYSLFRRLVTGKKENRYLKEFLRIVPGQRVLDIGCGPADLLADFPVGVDYHGYDHEPDYIASAKARYGDRGTFRVHAVTPDAVDDIGTFDVVLATAVLHHLTDEEAGTRLAGAAKVLRPGGRLVTLDGAYVEGQAWLARLLLKLDRGRFVRTPDAYLALARRHFGHVEATVVHDLIAIPYTHIILEAADPLPSL